MFMIMIMGIIIEHFSRIEGPVWRLSSVSLDSLWWLLHLSEVPGRAGH
jgi:hypothetical protein